MRLPCSPVIGPPQCFTDFDALPEGITETLAPEGGGAFFATSAWLRVMLQSGMPENASPRLLVCRLGAQPVALLPLQALDGGRSLSSLTNPYSCLFQPLLARGLSDVELFEIGRSLGGYCRGWPVVRLDALAEDSPGLKALSAGFRSRGLVLRRFAHFGNWHEPVAGIDWTLYLQSRSGELRELVRRRMRRAERERVAFEIVSGVRDVEAGIAAYESVYARSWKVAEPYPDFNPQMMRYAAEMGVLRLGIPACASGCVRAARPDRGAVVDRHERPGNGAEACP